MFPNNRLQRRPAGISALGQLLPRKLPATTAPGGGLPIRD
jgi:hypothetical protein